MDELELLRMRDEVLPALYWMRAEGLAAAPGAEELARFLAVPAPRLAPLLARFVERGWLEPVGDGYALSPEGEQLGKHAFAAEFADMTRPTHGECDEDCWCHEDPEEAARCLEERVRHVH